MGDFAVFVRGTSAAELNGGIVVETTDPAAIGAAHRAARPALAETSPGTKVEPLSAPGGGKGFTLRDGDVPAPVHVFQRDDRFVVAYGDAAAEDAVGAGADAWATRRSSRTPRQSLDGYDGQLLPRGRTGARARRVARCGGRPELAEAKPYLEPLEALVGGTAGDGDELRSAFKILTD